MRERLKSDPTGGDAAQALREFVSSGDEAAFRTVVAGHIGLVLGTARRQLGDESAAREVAQNVFTALVRKAAHVARHPQPAAWLHHCALIECRRHRRREHVHHSRMKTISEHLQNQNGRDLWTEVLPLLDQAIDALPAGDRRLILLRFFERRSFREIGILLGKSDDAVQKHTSRAVEKLARWLGRRGVTAGAAVLGAGLVEAVATAVPASLVPALASRAVAGASVATAPPDLLNLICRTMNTKTKASMAAGALVAATGLLWQHQKIQGLEREITHWRSLATADKDPRSPENPVEAMRRSRDVRRSPIASTVDSDAETSGSLAGWELALLEPDPLRRAQKLSSLLEKLDPAMAPDVDAIFARLSESGRSFSHERTLFLRAWGRLDGSAVLAHLSRNGSPNASPERLAALAGWASTDPAAARVWLETAAPDDARRELAYGLLDGWALRDFDGAAAYALSLPRSETREQIRRLLFERCLAAGDVPAAQKWLANLPDDEHNRLFKQRTFNDIVSTMLLRDPSSAARWISQLGNPAYLSADAVSQTAAKLAESAPAESLRWLESLAPDDPTITRNGYSEALAAWSRQNPDAAGTWLRERASHPAYDAMAVAHARAISTDDIPTAIAWANSATDADTRQRGLAELAREVVQKQGDAGRAALIEGGVSPEIVDQLKDRALYAYHRELASVAMAGEAVRWELAALNETRLAEANAVTSSIGATGAAGGGDEAQVDFVQFSDQGGVRSGLVIDPSATLQPPSLELQPLNLGPHPPGFASQNCSSCHNAR